MCLIRDTLEAIWNPYIWLPPNITWEDIAARKDVKYPDHRHAALPILFALMTLLARSVLERYVISRIGLMMGVKVKLHKKVPKNPTLEKAYMNESGMIRSHQITALAKQLDWSERQVQRWMRLRKVQDKPSALTKFCESFWRLCYYIGAFIFGVYVLWDKSWLWDIHQCWTGYPYQDLADDLWWYYIVSMTFYWSLMFSHYFDVKRSDFWQMFIHHCATVGLLLTSWLCNHVRVGSLVLVLHDLADVVLEAAKVAKYSNHMDVCNALFVVFAVTWLVTRLGLFPCWIMYNAAFDAPKILSYSISYFFSAFSLCLLFFLHIYWSYLIFSIVFKCAEGKQLDDIRSSSDAGADEIGVGEGDSTNIGDSPITKKSSRILRGDPGGDMATKRK